MSAFAQRPARLPAGAGHAYIAHTIASTWRLLIVPRMSLTWLRLPREHRLPTWILFHENLADATDELASAFDIFIAGNNWNKIFTAGGVAAVAITTAAQQDTVKRGLQTLMGYVRGRG